MSLLPRYMTLDGHYAHSVSPNRASPLGHDFKNTSASGCQVVTSDVIVIGAGVVGLSCAYSLARRGANVHLIDAGEVGSGASRTNAGWVVPSMSEPVPSPGALRTAARYAFKSDGPLKIGVEPSARYVSFLARMLASCRPSVYARGLAATAALSLHAVQAFDDLTVDGVAFERHKKGILMLFLDEAGVAPHARDLKTMESRGLPSAQVLTAQEVRNIEPAVSRHVTGGILCPQDEYVDPSSLVDGLAARCRELGVRMTTYQAVSDLVPRADGVSVIAGLDRHRASSVVVAAGVKTRSLLQRLGLQLPIRAGKGYGFDLETPSVDLRHGLYLSDHKVAATPLTSGLRLAGTMEFGSDDLAVDERRSSGILRAASHYFESWSPPPAPVAWSGLRPMTPDGLPMIGRIPGTAPIYVAAGHAMLGITLGPVTGSLIGSLIADGAAAPELAPFAPDRFSSQWVRHSSRRTTLVRQR
jgi:D-amino-acid dehydrogenase